jgi:adenylosuccinate synthase
MSVAIVIGAQWGDEGKGKVIDWLTDRADVVARYSGGANAGHTIINDLGEFKLRQVPAGIFHPECLCIIGNGVVVNPEKLVFEMETLASRGVSLANLRISDKAHIVLPHHFKLEAAQEERRGDARLGTTGNGIGPAYVDKAAREGIRVADLIRPAVFEDRLRAVLAHENKVLQAVYGVEPVSFEGALASYRHFAERLAPHVAETTSLLRQQIRAGKRVLLEGAQGTMLDPDLGTYPFVTSSHPTAAGACVGVGIGPTAITSVIAVVKAYSTRVGAGPLPTELNEATGERIRQIGHEYGTATGRARRCGWFDAVVARYGCDANGATAIALTRLDILDGFEEIQICTGYRLDGRPTEVVPTTIDEFARCEPVYETLPGWLAPTAGARAYDDLPGNARRYVERISDLCGAPIAMIGVGPHRHSAIELAMP